MEYWEMEELNWQMSENSEYELYCWETNNGH